MTDYIERNRKHEDTAHPLNSKARKMIECVVFKAYEEVMKKFPAAIERVSNSVEQKILFRCEINKRGEVICDQHEVGQSGDIYSSPCKLIEPKNRQT